MKNLVVKMHIGAVDGRVRTVRQRTELEKHDHAFQKQTERENHWFYVRYMSQSNSVTIGSVANRPTVSKPAAGGIRQRFDKRTNSWVKLS